MSSCLELIVEAARHRDVGGPAVAVPLLEGDSSVGLPPPERLVVSGEPQAPRDLCRLDGPQQGSITKRGQLPLAILLLAVASKQGGLHLAA